MNTSMNSQNNHSQIITKNQNVDAEKEPDESIQNSDENPNEQERMEDESLTADEKVLGINFRIEISCDNNTD